MGGQVEIDDPRRATTTALNSARISDTRTGMTLSRTRFVRSARSARTTARTSPTNCRSCRCRPLRAFPFRRPWLFRSPRCPVRTRVASVQQTSVKRRDIRGDHAQIQHERHCVRPSRRLQCPGQPESTTNDTQLPRSLQPRTRTTAK